MHSIKAILLLSTLTLSGLVAAAPSSSVFDARSTCSTCDPTSGKNLCAAGTYCMPTGNSYHCACEQGFKASANNADAAQYRLTLSGPYAPYSNYVFVQPGTSCPVQCNAWDGKPADLCNEVPVRTDCSG